MVKEVITGTGNGEWNIFDSVREPTNPNDNILFASTSGSESVNNIYSHMDFLSNGFKLRTAHGTASQVNFTTTYIYLAFAETPFKHSNAR